MITGLKDQLEGWDGIHMDYLTSIYNSFHEQSDFFDHLISLTSEQPQLQEGTTWLIKHHYDEKKELSKDQLDELLNSVAGLKHWAANLHVLQILPHIEIKSENYIIIDDFVRRSWNSDNKFVRAWSYQGLLELYKFQPSNKPELMALCEKAMINESASIKVKVRNLIKHLETH